MNADLLRRVFERVLQASLLSPVALGACGPLQHCTDACLEERGYHPITCNQGPPLTGLSPSVIPDAIQLRWAYGESDPSTQVISQEGTPCSQATNKPTCEAAVAALRPSPGIAFYTYSYARQLAFLVLTQQDTVTAIQSVAELQAFLGTLDSDNEAVLWAYLDRYQGICNGREHAGVKSKDGGYEIQTLDGTTCGAGTSLNRLVLGVEGDGRIEIRSHEVVAPGDPYCVIGRRPAGLTAAGVRQRTPPCRSPLGQHLANAATLEAASVHAFVRLGEELRAHGASARLQQCALRSAREEVAHAHVTTRLAQRFGAKVQAPHIQAVPLRSLYDVALENAVEGCVRETFGALVAHHQAAHARDPELRREYGTIAHDETRHAGLSWEIHAWANTVLNAEERRSIGKAQRLAVDVLRDEVAERGEDVIQELAGLPAPQVASRYVDQLGQALWKV